MFEQCVSWKQVFTAVILAFSGSGLQAQGTGLPLGNNAYETIDRLEIRAGFQNGLHSAIKPYDRSAVTSWLSLLDTTAADFSSPALQRDLWQLALENTEWLQTPVKPRSLFEKAESSPAKYTSQAHRSLSNSRYVKQQALLKYFYHTPANFWEINGTASFLKISPVFQFSLGSTRNDPGPYYLNQFGFDLRGGFGDRLFYSFRLLGSRARFPNYVNRLIEEQQSIPHQGEFREYENEWFDFDDGYGFTNSQWQVGFNFSRSGSVQFGRGNNFMGDGYRSLVLSDFTNNYLHLKLNWKIWKFHYQNIFAELSPAPGMTEGREEIQNKKYLVAHFLSYHFSKKLNIAIFEAVTLNRGRQFELQYLNPLILYRTVEQSLGSPDNVFLGGQLKWNFARHFQLYGQIVFDEIKFSELTSGEGWWGNKFGTQVGIKYIDAFGIPHLDFQFERNVVRPYTYTHTDSLSAYTHFDLPLAHPVGANFTENLILARYRPIPRLHFDARLLSIRVGEDETGINWGHSLLRSNETRSLEYGNEVGQGIESDILIFRAGLSYQFAHNIFLDLYYRYRNKDSQDDVRDQTTNLWGAGLRMNIRKQKMDF